MSDRWRKEADRALAGFHGVGNAAREAVAVALGEGRRAALAEAAEAACPCATGKDAAEAIYALADDHP